MFDWLRRKDKKLKNEMKEAARTKVEFKYCTTTGNAELKVDAKNIVEAKVLLNEYLVKFYDMYMMKIIKVMKETDAEMKKMLRTGEQLMHAQGQAPQGQCDGKGGCGKAECQSKGGEEGVPHKPADPKDPMFL